MDESEHEFARLYGPVARAVLSDETQEIAGFDVSPAELARRVCQITGEAELDLLAERDFAAAYDSDVLPLMLAHAMIACLRHLLFARAQESGIGTAEKNVTALIHAQVWQKKLLEKWLARHKGETPRHTWIH